MKAQGLVVLAASIPLGLAAAGCGGEDSDGSGRDPELASIVAPHNDGLVRGRDALVRVRTSPEVKSFQAFVDDKRVTARFGAPRNGVRSATLRVPYGVNRLYVRVRSDEAEDFDQAKFVAARRDPGLVSGSASATASASASRHTLPRAPAHLEATLNGRRLERPGSVRDGLDGDDGVRPGTNRVVITAATGDGRYDRVAQTVNAPRDRPVAGGGLPQHGQVDRPIALNGSATRPSRPGAPVRYRWRVVAGPDRAKPRLDNADTARPTFVADRVGRYTVQLQARHPGGRLGRDTVTVTAEPKLQPYGWRLETIPAGVNGIKLNGQVAKQADGKSSASGGNWVQLAVLDNQTLNVKVAAAFNRGQSSALKTAIGNATTHDIVVLTGAGHKQGTSLSSSDVGLLRDSWKRLGGTLRGFIPTKPSNNDPGFESGQWSIVGRGTSKGAATPPTGAAEQAYAIAAGPGEAPGGMSGQLQKNTHNVYRFQSSEYVSLVTNVSPGDGKTSIRVGDDLYTSKAMSGAGFYLLVLDAGTLAKKEDGIYQTEDQNGNQSGAASPLANKLRSYINAKEQVVVILQSIGNPRPRPNDPFWETSLAPAIGAVGGTENVVLDLDGTGGYVLVGGTELSTRYGEELSGPMTKQTAQLKGVLMRNSLGAMEANYTDPAGRFDLKILELASQSTQAFPAWKTEGQQKVYDNVARLLEVGGDPDVRVDYWYNPDVYKKKDDLKTKVTVDALKAIGVTGVNQDDVEAVTSQLDTEFGHVRDIREWIGKIQTIYRDAKSSNYVNVLDIANKIKGDAQVPSSSHSNAEKILDALSETLYIATEFSGEGEGFGPAIGAVAGIMGLAALAETDEHGDPIDAEIDSKVSDLAPRMDADYQATIRGLDRLGDILVSDPHKLDTAGRAVTQTWFFNTDKQNVVGDTLERTARRTVWKALMGIPWRNDILHSTDLNDGPQQARNYTCEFLQDPQHPFTWKPYGKETDLGQVRAATGYDGTQLGHQLHAFGDDNNNPNNLTPKDHFLVPSKASTDQLFTIDNEDPKTVGFYRLEFFSRYMKKRDVRCVKKF